MSKCKYRYFAFTTETEHGRVTRSGTCDGTVEAHSVDEAKRLVKERVGKNVQLRNLSVSEFVPYRPIDLRGC